jgi:hypothetical protein
MANAGFGLPKDVTFISANATLERPASNLLNDEPGLVFKNDAMANGSSVILFFSVEAYASSEMFASVLGVPEGFDVTVKTFASSAHQSAGTPSQFTGASSGMSSNRTGLKKFLFIIPETTSAWFMVQLTNNSGVTADCKAWRVLFGNWVEPSDNVEVGATATIDDRQNRRYSNTGRRNFTSLGIYPAFSGNWPWINATEYKTLIKPMTRLYGASKPVVFCLDYEETTWGEDDLYYGDLEKEQSIKLDDGELYGFSFSIVDIAPVQTT